MTESEHKPTTQDSSLSEDLEQFYNEFAQFNECYAFFCDALADVVSKYEKHDVNTIQGMNRCCRWMKQRMEGFRLRLDGLQKKACNGNG